MKHIHSRIIALALATCATTAMYAETEQDQSEINTPALETLTAENETTEQALEAEMADESKAYDMENGVLPIADNRGFTLQSKDGNFVFKPYLMLQTSLTYRYYDDVGLDRAYNQDNIANSGFAIPFAIIGFTGKAFGKIDYNISINAAASGGAMLQQAWIDYAANSALRFRVGKLKTPFTSGFMTTLGETLFPFMPTSLTATTILPYSLNAVTPTISTGWDLGVEMHGVVKNKLGYEVGIFNGTGATVNSATKGMSDDNHMPSLLYAGRIYYMPNGPMPMTQGNAKMLNLDKMLIGISANYNNEAENESTNDFRAGFEFSWLKNRWFFGLEAYYMHIGFTKRQKISESYNFWGGYAQVGYFFTPQWQAGLRYDVMDRNGSSKDGLVNSPAVSINYFVPNTNIKISAAYQYTARWGHDTQLDRDLDELGLNTHTGMIMMQYTF